MSRLRSARTFDEAALVGLERSCFGTEAWSSTGIREELTAVPGTRYVMVAADTDDVPVGFAVLSVYQPTAELLRIAVRPDRRRRGIGRTLLADLVAEADRRSCDELWLEVRADNEPALRLYEVCGFETIARRPGYYALGQVDALVLRRLRR